MQVSQKRQCNITCCGTFIKTGNVRSSWTHCIVGYTSSVV